MPWGDEVSAASSFIETQEECVAVEGSASRRAADAISGVERRRPFRGPFAEVFALSRARRISANSGSNRAPFCNRNAHSRCFA